jgi:hypothetical protein
LVFDLQICEYSDHKEDVGDHESVEKEQAFVSVRQDPTRSLAEVVTDEEETQESHEFHYRE